MAQLTIRDVPESVKDALVSAADARGQSLQAYVLAVLRRQADFTWNGEQLMRVESDVVHGGGADDSAPRAAEVLAGERSVRGGRVDADEPT